MYQVDPEILREMEAGTERASVIVGHAHIEEECTAALRKMLRKHSAFDDAIKQGFLNNHTARVNLLHLLGAYNDEIRNDLRILARIRNEFAHNSHVKDFTNPTASKLLAKITLLSVGGAMFRFSEGHDAPRRQQFEYCVGNAVAILRRRYPQVSLE